MGLRAEIVDAMAELLWADGWMTHVEEHGCERISGREITEIMPRIPKEARVIAEKWAKDVEQSNNKDLDDLYEEALAANERESTGGGETDVHSSPSAFGYDLVHMMTGAGASWFDSNAEFDLRVPRHEGGGELADLMYLAGSRCKAAWKNPACTECGAFSREGSSKCSNCGEPIEQEEER